MLSSFGLFILLLLPQVDSMCKWSEHIFSEESSQNNNSPFSDVRKQPGQAIRGIQCEHNNPQCDKKLVLYCSEYHVGGYVKEYFDVQSGDDKKCPDGTVVTYIKCQESTCGKLWLFCGTPTNFVVQGGITRTEFFSEEIVRNEGACGRDAVMVGLNCEGPNCDNLQLICQNVSKLDEQEVDENKCTKIDNGETHCEGRCTWTDFISSTPNNGHGEDTDKHHTNQHAAIGMRCRGSDCTEVSLLTCDNLLFTMQEKSYTETDWFSEEDFKTHDNKGKCVNPNQAIASVQCKNGRCDDKNLWCRRGVNFKIDKTVRTNTKEFKDANHGVAVCKKGYVATGVKCVHGAHGGDCARMKLRCAPYTMGDFSAKTGNKVSIGGFWKKAQTIDHLQNTAWTRKNIRETEISTEQERSRREHWSKTVEKSREFSICKTTSSAPKGGVGAGSGSSTCATTSYSRSDTKGWAKEISKSTDVVESESIAESVTWDIKCKRATWTTNPDVTIDTSKGCTLFQWVLFIEETEPSGTFYREEIPTFFFDIIEIPGNKPKCVLGMCKDDTDCQECWDGPKIKETNDKDWTPSATCDKDSDNAIVGGINLCREMDVYQKCRANSGFMYELCCATCVSAEAVLAKKQPIPGYELQCSNCTQTLTESSVGAGFIETDEHKEFNTKRMKENYDGYPSNMKETESDVATGVLETYAHSGFSTIMQNFGTVSLAFVFGAIAFSHTCSRKHEEELALLYEEMVEM